GPLARRTRKTITDLRTLRARIAEVRERGYAVTIAENHPEMGGVAAPVRDHSGAAVAACGVAIPEYRMNENVIARAIPCVLRAAAALSAELGHAQVDRRRSARAA
ncbi:MAG TPA: IclR family transcriptional regulator C-terminal domain-containing protein, partial [Casimicrobiaceae bacterium]